MSTVYESMKQLAIGEVKMGWGVFPKLRKNGDIDLMAGVYGNNGGHAIATVTSQNTATLHNTSADQGYNIIYGKLGLGAIVNGTSSKARLVYWLNGMTTRYVPGMQIDLNTNTAIGATAIEDLTTDTKARSALMKLLRSKAPMARLYLKMNDTIPTGMSFAERKVKYSPAAFLEAVHKDDVPRIAITPFLMDRGFIRRNLKVDSKAELYVTTLEAYIDQNRAELYRLGGVTK